MPSSDSYTRRDSHRRARAGRGGSPTRPLLGPSGRGGRVEGYWALSMRPLHILVFLAPLVVLYEIGSIRYLASSVEGTRQTILAQRLLGQFFELFGAAGLVLPGAALLTVLLIWHWLLGDRWRVRGWVLGGMGLESLAWTMPLLVLAAVHSGAVDRMAEAAYLLPVLGRSVDPAGGLAALPWQARLTVAIGAGLYEEMLFRLVLIALLHMIFADLLRMNSGVAAVLAVLGAAVAFGLYHDTTLPGGGTNWPTLLFYTAAGAYLGAVYMLRGFGIVVGTHAMYDVMVLVLLRP